MRRFGPTTAAALALVPASIAAILATAVSTEATPTDDDPHWVCCNDLPMPTPTYRPRVPRPSDYTPTERPTFGTTVKPTTRP